MNIWHLLNKVAIIDEFMFLHSLLKFSISLFKKLKNVYKISKWLRITQLCYRDELKVK